MKTCLLAVLADLACYGTASAQEHKTYRCKITDVVTLADDGRLRADDNPKNVMRQLYTGAVTNRDGTRRIW